MMMVLHLLQLYSVKSQGDAAMSTGVKSFQYSIVYYRQHIIGQNWLNCNAVITKVT